MTNLKHDALLPLSSPLYTQLLLIPFTAKFFIGHRLRFLLNIGRPRPTVTVTVHAFYAVYALGVGHRGTGYLPTVHVPQPESRPGGSAVDRRCVHDSHGMLVSLANLHLLLSGSL
jgi:hypothetical protein